ncbi:MAG: TRAP transporter small permease [Castellaniella sp.]
MQTVMRRLATVARGLSAFIIFAMMIITVIDVTGRYVFNAPLLGALELTELLMGLLVFMGLPLATRQREHITITLLADVLPPQVRIWQRRFFELVCGVICVLVAWRMWLYSARLVRSGEHTQQLQISIGLVVQVMAVLMLITAFVFFINVFRRRTGSVPTPI